MKNTIFIFSFFLFTVSTVTAQEDVIFGVKGGFNLFNMSSDGFADTHLQTGIHLGLLAEIPIGEKFSL